MKAQLGTSTISMNISMNRPKTIQFLLVLILGLSLVGIAAQFAPGIYNRYIYDDFCEANAIQSISFGNYAIREYLQWTGRYSGIILRGLATAGGIGFLSSLPYLFLVFTMLAFYWCLLPLAQKTNLPKPKLITATIVSLFLCTLYGILPKFFESVFWKSSSTIYTPPLILFFLQAGLLLRVYFSGRSNLLPLFILVTFIASGFSEIYNVLQLTLLIITAFGLIITKKHKSHPVFVRYLYAAFITAFLGTLIQFVSPGNQVRQAASNHPDGIPLIEFPYQLLRATAIEFYVFVIYGWTWLIPLSLFSFTLGTSRVFNNSGESFNNNKNILGLKIWRVFFYLGSGVLLIAIAIATPSAYYQGDAPEPRSLIMIFPILMISLIAGMYLLGWHFSAHKINWKTLVMKIILAVALLTLIVQVGIEVLESAKALPAQKEYAHAWDARDRELKNLVAQGIKETEITILTNAYAYSDLSENPKVWVNRCFAEYYNLDSITGITKSD